MLAIVYANQKLRKCMFYCLLLIFLGLLFLVPALSKIFGPAHIVSRNCTHISIKSNIKPDVEGFQFFWNVVTINGTTNNIVRNILLCFLFLFLFFIYST